MVKINSSVIYAGYLVLIDPPVFYMYNRMYNVYNFKYI